MTAIEAFLSAMGLKLQVIVAGAVGSFISLRFFDGLGTGERWATFFGGLGLAAYLTESIFVFFELTSIKIESGLALLIGLFGMSLVAAVIKTIRETDWASFVKRRTGGG